VAGEFDGQVAQTYHAVGPTLQKDFPEIESYARLRSWFGSTVVSHTPGLDLSKFKLTTIRVKAFLDSSNVSLAGQFNGWNPNEHPMRKQGDEWVTQLKLMPGKYSYKLVVNGNWLTDPTNPLVDTADFNNSILLITDTESPGKVRPASQEIAFKEDGVYFADPSFLQLFSFPLLSGNAATALNENNSILLSQSMARKHFGKENPMGKLLNLKEGDQTQPKIVTGIFKDIPHNSHLQINFLLSYASLGSTDNDWGRFVAYTYVLLAPGINPASVENKLANLIHSYKANMLNEQNAREELFLQALQDIHLYSDLDREIKANGNIRIIYFLVIIAGFVLAIAWVNYINLSTARAIERAKEVGIRKVVGANRMQLLGQFMMESCLINMLGAVLALTIVQFTLPFFNEFTGQEMPLALWRNPQIWFVFILLFITGTLLSGIYPAFVLSSYQPVLVVKGKWRSSTSGILLRKGLVIAQFMISVVLIAGTLTVYRQLEFMQNRDLGINMDQVLVVKSPTVRNKAFEKNFDVFRNEVLRNPAVKSFAMTDVVPGMEDIYSDTGLKREGSDAVNPTSFKLIWADYDFISTFGIKLLSGRPFSREFSTDNQGVIINEAAAHALGFASPQEAVNQKVSYSRDFKYQVLGVVNNYHQKSLKEDYMPMIFLLNPKVGRCYSIKLDTKNITGSLAAIERTYQSVFPGNPFDYFFLNEFFDAQYKKDRQFRRVFTLFTALAIIVACLGLFGLASFATTQRTKEIGVRKVLGASVNNIIFLLSKDFMQLILVSNLIAWPLAYWGIREWLQGYAFRIEVNMWLFILPALLVWVIALLTVSVQTIKAAKSNPVKSLRYE
jgi:putative ABC transport system permease protein